MCVPTQLEEDALAVVHNSDAEFGPMLARQFKENLLNGLQRVDRDDDGEFVWTLTKKGADLLSLYETRIQ